MTKTKTDRMNETDSLDTASADKQIRALIAEVEPDSPAFEAGFEPGCFLTHVDGHRLRDLIDWRWYSAENSIEVGYIDLDGDAGVVRLEREDGREWGFVFKDLVFDRIKQCRNSCIFCFMRQLPTDMRSSLSLRDDDFRLSFLAGTFVTLTNLSPEDEARIVEQHISPLRVSLHASDASVRRRLIGRHAQHGLDCLERLLDAGIEISAQIVLVPDVNDGEVLCETLAWAWAKPNIRNIGIVPLGFTGHQADFDHSFNDPDDACAIVELIAPFQKRALAERGTPWVFAADEFYRNAYRSETLSYLPPAEQYGDFPLFEDGIGIIRSCADEFAQALSSGLAQTCADALKDARVRIRYIVGQAMQPFFDVMIAQSPLSGYFVPLTVKNDYFGGNVDVTGLLCCCDIVKAIRSEEEKNRDSVCRGKPEDKPEDKPEEERSRRQYFRELYLIPDVVFNDTGMTLDDADVEDMKRQAGQDLYVVSCNPLEYLSEICGIVERLKNA